MFTRKGIVPVHERICLEQPDKVVAILAGTMPYQIGHDDLTGCWLFSCYCPAFREVDEGEQIPKYWRGSNGDWHRDGTYEIEPLPPESNVQNVWVCLGCLAKLDLKPDGKTMGLTGAAKCHVCRHLFYRGSLDYFPMAKLPTGMPLDVQSYKPANGFRPVNRSGWEYAWVIEHGQSKSSAPLYFCGFDPHETLPRLLTHKWSHDSACAVRFSRKQDAEAMLPAFHETHRVAEHGWDTTPAGRDWIAEGLARQAAANGGA